MKGHGVTFGDLDIDGDQDIFAQIGGMFSKDYFANSLYENPGHRILWITSAGAAAASALRTSSSR